MRRKTFMINFLLVCICACATTDQTRLDFVKTWEGKTLNDLISQLGPPSQVLDDGQGGQLVIYSTSGKKFAISDFQRQADYFHSPDVDNLFWLNSQGRIYRVWTKKRGRL